LTILIDFWLVFSNADCVLDPFKFLHIKWVTPYFWESMGLKYKQSIAEQSAQLMRETCICIQWVPWFSAMMCD
jgi:hypothetical protein